MKFKLPGFLRRGLPKTISGAAVPGAAVALQSGRCIVLMNGDKLPARIGKETLVVCGLARGRTSVVSYALRRMGYFIGEKLQPKNHEDLEFLDLLRVTAKTGELKHTPKLKQLIRHRNEAHVRWGFKMPGAIWLLRPLEPLFRNPVFVVCIRNPVAVMRSIARYRPDRKEDQDWFLMPSLGVFASLQAALPHLTAPVLLVDMDMALQDTEAFLTELMTLIGVEGDITAIAAEIAAPGYKKIAEGGEQA